MTAIRGSGGGSRGGSRTPVEAPDSLHSVARAKIIDVLTEGEVYGPTDDANPLSCIFYNETPVANDDGTLNFRDVQIDWRDGTQDQDYIKGFPAVESEIAVGVELTDTTPWTKALTNLDLSAVRVLVSVAGLREQDTGNADVKGYRIEYALDLAVDGGAYTALLTTAFDGKTNSTYQRSHRIDLPTATTGWTVRVRRITPNSAASNIADTTQITSYTEVIDGKFRYPNSAVVGHQVDSAQFPTVPRRAYDWKGRIVQIPSNYDPALRTYTGVWDGTFTSAWTDNPAWVFYDLVLNARYGLGHLVSAAQVDKWSLYEIAQYCDELVPDGSGGTEPRMTCNVYLQTRADAYRVLTDLASCFRGMAYWGAGQITAVQDAPSDPVYTYTPSNVIDGRFTYAGSGRRARHTVALVGWNDLGDFGRQKIEPVMDEEGIALYGTNETSIIAFGCTSRGQAIRMGRHILATERYENDTVQFAVGLDGTIARPGQVVYVSDPLRAGKRTGGRIASATTTTVTVDEIPAPAPVAGDTLVVILPSGVAQTRVISSIAGNVITVSVAFSTTPVPQSIWAVESTALALQRFRVLNVAEGDGLTHVITALKHEPDKYAYIDTEDPVEPLDTYGGTEVPAAPTGLTLTTFQRHGHGTAFNVIEADWASVPGATKYEIYWRKDNGGWSAPRRIGDSNDEWDSAFAGTYRAKVCAISPVGIAGPFTLSDPVTVTDAVLPEVVLGIVAGVLTVDCRYSKFRLPLTQNVTSVVFTNVAPQDTLLFRIEQAGGFTINWGPNVNAISGVPFTMTTTAGSVAMVGLDTNDSGVTWDMAYSKPDETIESGESFVVTLSPSPASATSDTDGTTASAPSVQVTATTANGVDPVTHSWTRADSDGGTDFTISSTTAAAPTFSIPSGTTAYPYTTQSWRDTTTDSLAQQAQAVVQVSLERTYTPPPTVLVAISDQSIADGVLAPSDAFAAYRIKAVGTATRVQGSSETSITGEWLVSGAAADYEVRATLFSGDTPTGTLGTWLSTSTDREWSLSAISNAGQIKTCQLTVEIRDVATLTVRDTATITLNAETSL